MTLRKALKKKVWLSAKDVRARYGGASEMTIWRWGRDPKLNFPEPVYINNRRFWDEEKLDDFDAELVRASLADREGRRVPA